MQKMFTGGVAALFPSCSCEAWSGPDVVELSFGHFKSELMSICSKCVALEAGTLALWNFDSKGGCWTWTSSRVDLKLRARPEICVRASVVSYSQ